MKIPLNINLEEFLIFNNIFLNQLIFNTNWEDPEIDRKILKLNSNSKVLTITSAGSNAIEYILDNPKSIDAVDINIAQNSLTVFKKSLYQINDYQALKDIFINGNCNCINDILNQELPLKKNYFNYLKNHIIYFKNKKSFYYYGLTGKAAYFISYLLKKDKTLNKNIEEIFSSDSTIKQIEIYNKIENRIFNKFVKFFSNLDFLSIFFGVPSKQIKLIKAENSSIIEYIKKNIRKLLNNVIMKDNYFWQVYYYGRYRNSIPEYLKESNFQYIQKNINCLNIHHSSLEQFLLNTDRKFTHFILLDHLDWFYDDNYKIEKTFDLIFKRAEPNAKILFRSASSNRNFITRKFLNRIDFKDKISKEMHLSDRVGTYNSLHYGIIND